MGNCDSSMENRHKLNSKISLSNNIGEFSSNSSTNLSISNYSSLNSIHNIKKYNSQEKTNPMQSKQYILPETIAKREDVFKKYRFSKHILGDGATSIVYLAENSSRQKFAIKRIPKEKMEVRLNVVLREAEICLKLKNKNIIKYYEIYEDLHFISIVMEQADTDLFELIINSPIEFMSEELIIDFLIQIFEVIDYLHNVVNIVHCDIKPENFVVKFDKKNGNKPSLKLVDFGNARRKPINKERLFNFSGTKEYMAPEAMDNCGFNEKVDEWAAGIIMFNLLTGADPFSSGNDLEYRDNIKYKKIKFEYIKNEKLRELNKKLLNRFVVNRITAKEALEEIKQIKNNLKFGYNINNRKIKDIGNNRILLINMS